MKFLDDGCGQVEDVLTKPFVCSKFLLIEGEIRSGTNCLLSKKVLQLNCVSGMGLCSVFFIHFFIDSTSYKEKGEC